ncbi:MAG: aminotransferase class I/II-fold pyridoxal phosphate-dependent enzyme [Oscillospiraceae bacterium]|nr:aminotransferase class I/II-fold pyridoxal phosphate-dependent enzyme [Oscillospiraceae bacterium]
MKPVESSDKLKIVHSDIRGPVFEKAQEMSRQGIEVLKLNTGNPATFGFTMPPSVKNALLANADKAVAYCDAKGMPEARQALAEYHTSRGLQDITPDDIYIGNGVSELAPMICNSVLSAGDELLMPAPSYSLWSNAAYLAGAKPVFYTCDEASDWYPDVADMEKKVTARTKAVLLINPNNPTGQVYAPELVEQVCEFARRHDLLVISDEIYDRLIIDDVPYRSTAAIAPDLPVVTLNGLSKSHIICGFRCGWAVVSGPRDLTAALKECLGKLCAMRLCGNALTQLVIPAAMNDPESTKAMLVPGGRIYEQREAACKALDALAERGLVSYRRPHAAFYVFPKILGGKVKNDKQFAFDVLAAKHILIVAGSGFDWPEPDHFRLVLLPEAEKIYQAVLEIGDFLETYQQ